MTTTSLNRILYDYMRKTHGVRAMPILAKDYDQLLYRVLSFEERVSWYGCLVNGTYMQGRDALYYVRKFLQKGVWKSRETTITEEKHIFDGKGANTNVRASSSDRGADELRKSQIAYVQSLTKKPDNAEGDSIAPLITQTDYTDRYFAPGEMVSYDPETGKSTSEGELYCQLTDEEKAELTSYRDLVYLLRSSKFHLWELYGETWIFKFTLRPELVEKIKVKVIPDIQNKGKGKTGKKGVQKGDAPHGPIVSMPGRVIGSDIIWVPMTVTETRKGMHWQGGKIVGNKPFYDGASPRTAVKSVATGLKQVVFSNDLESATIHFLDEEFIDGTNNLGRIWYQERAKDLVDVPDTPLYQEWQGEWRKIHLPSMRPKDHEKFLSRKGGYIGHIKSRDKNPARPGPSQNGVGRMRGSMQEGEWKNRWHYEVFFSYVAKVFPNDIHRPAEFVFKTHLTHEDGVPHLNLELVESFRKTHTDKEIAVAFNEVTEFIKPIALRRVKTDNKVIVDGRVYSDPSEQTETLYQKVNPTFLELVQFHSLHYDPERDFMDWNELNESRKRRRQRQHKIATIDCSRRSPYENVKDIRKKKGKKSKMRGKKRQRLKGLR